MNTKDKKLTVVIDTSKPLDICAVCRPDSLGVCEGIAFCAESRILTCAVLLGRIGELKDGRTSGPYTGPKMITEEYMNGYKMGIAMALNPITDMLSGTSAEEIVARCERNFKEATA